MRAAATPARHLEVQWLKLASMGSPGWTEETKIKIILGLSDIV